METRVKFIGKPTRPGTADWIRRRVELGLDRHADAIRTVLFTLADVNGSRGGVDQRCIMHVRLRAGGRPIVVRAQEDTIEAAACKAVARARRRITGRLRSSARSAA